MSILRLADTVLGLALVTALVLPGLAAATHEEQAYVEDTADCVVTHAVYGWFVGNCLEEPPTMQNLQEAVQCFNEYKDHLKHALLCFPR